MRMTKENLAFEEVLPRFGEDFIKWYRKAEFRDRWLKWLTFPIAFAVLFIPSLLVLFLGSSMMVRKHGGVIPALKALLQKED